MAVTELTESFADLVVDDPREFRVHGSVYTDAEVFAAELERIFERTWVYAGHESELPATGDYKTILVGTQPVILSRHEDGKVHALYNRCRHRGAVVCRQERGHSNFFRCRYHNWVYANNGDLIGMSQSTGYPDDFDRSAYGLVPVVAAGPAAVERIDRRGGPEIPAGGCCAGAPTRAWPAGAPRQPEPGIELDGADDGPLSRIRQSDERQILRAAVDRPLRPAQHLHLPEPVPL